MVSRIVLSVVLAVGLVAPVRGDGCAGGELLGIEDAALYYGKGRAIRSGLAFGILGSWIGTSIAATTLRGKPVPARRLDQLSATHSDDFMKCYRATYTREANNEARRTAMYAGILGFVVVWTPIAILFGPRFG